MNDLVFYDSEKDLPILKEWAKKLDINKIILAKTFSEEELLKLKTLIEKEDFPFFTCHVMQSTDTNELKYFKQNADLVCVLGFNLKLNKFAVSQKQIDFLLHPLIQGKLEIDTGICQLAQLNKTKIAFLFNEFNSLQGFPKSLLLKNSFLLVQLIKKYNLETFFFTGAKTYFDLRSIKNLKSFAVMLGFSNEQAKSFIEKQENLCK